MLNVIAIMNARPAKRDELLRLLRAIVPEVRRENGCIEFGPPVIDAPGYDQATFGPNKIVVIEKWSSSQALDAHAKAKHMVEFTAQAAHLIDSIAVHVLAAP